MIKNPLWIEPHQAFHWATPIGYARLTILVEVKKAVEVFRINCPIDIIIFLPKKKCLDPLIYAYCLQVNRFQCSRNAKESVELVRDLTIHEIELQYRNSRQGSIFKHPSHSSQWDRFMEMHDMVENTDNEYNDAVESLVIDTKAVQVDEIDSSQEFESIITNDINGWPLRNESHNFKRLRSVIDE